MTHTTAPVTCPLCGLGCLEIITAPLDLDPATVLAAIVAGAPATPASTAVLAQIAATYGDADPTLVADLAGDYAAQTLDATAALRRAHRTPGAAYAY